VLVITTDNSSTFSGVQTSASVVDEHLGATVTGGHGQRPVITFVAEFPLPHVRCIAAGGFPPPSVSVFLDHRDITDRFNVVQRSTLHGVRGLQVTTFCHITVISPVNDLTCVDVDLNYAIKTVRSVILDVRYKADSCLLIFGMFYATHRWSVIGLQYTT